MKELNLRPSEYAFAIKQQISMRDVIRRYTACEPKKSRIPCPIHNGTDYNFSFNDGGFHCFVCGASGDVIGFVQQYFDLSFSDAVAKLNNDFCLCLPICPETSHYDEAKQQAIRRQSAFDRLNAALHRQAAEELEAEYWVRLRVYKLYCEAVERYKPSYPTAEPSAKFLHALKYRTEAERKLDECFERICNLGGEKIDNAG